MVTNSVKRFKEADNLLFLEKGRLVNKGTYEHLKVSDQAFGRFLASKLGKPGNTNKVAQALITPSSRERQLSTEVVAPLCSDIDEEAQSMDKGLLSTLRVYVHAGTYRLTIIAFTIGLLAWPLFQESHLLPYILRKPNISLNRLVSLIMLRSGCTMRQMQRINRHGHGLEAFVQPRSSI